MIRPLRRAHRLIFLLLALLLPALLLLALLGRPAWPTSAWPAPPLAGRDGASAPQP